MWSLRGYLVPAGHVLVTPDLEQQRCLERSLTCWQVSHLYGFSPLCVLLCRSMWYFWMNRMLHWSQLNGFSPAHTEPKSFIGGGGGSSGWQTTTTNQGNRLTAVDLLVSLEEVLLDETHAALTALEGPLAWKQAQNRTHREVHTRPFASEWNRTLSARRSIHLLLLFAILCKSWGYQCG